MDERMNEWIYGCGDEVIDWIGRLINYERTDGSVE